MKSCYSLFFVLVLLTACADDVETLQPAARLPDSTNKAKQFFPVLDFLKGEMRTVDSFATAVRHITTINGKTDSGYVTPEQFKAVMQEFLPADLSKENFERYYTESSFFDQGSETSTFTYSTKNDDLEFHRVDVLVQGSDAYDKVSSVYLEKFTANGDSSLIKKVLFRSGNSVLISAETSRGNQQPYLRQDKYIWGNWE